jgi:ParB family chromosome partitioning protein
MQKQKGGLGRGLGSLLSASAQTPQMTAASFAPEPIEVVSTTDLQIREVSPVSIRENPRQPRTNFKPEDLAELESSIREHGILQPLIVTEVSPGSYELIAGERRLRASRAIGLEKIPVVIRPREDDRKKLELALIENIQRSDLNAVEEARAYKALIDEFGLRQEDVAQKVGKSRPAVANALRLLELDEEMLEALVDGSLMRSHARTLLAEPDIKRRRELFMQMVSGGGMTVREAEARAGSRTRVVKGKDPNVAALEAELRDKLGTKIGIEMQGAGGKIVVHFYSKEDLKHLIERLSRS